MQPDITERHFFIYARRPVSIPEFVKFWAAGYEDPHEELYTKNIDAPRTHESLRELFKWKIGDWLFARALTRTLEPHFLSQIEKAKRLPPDALVFLDAFPNGGAIYRIFWLHCWHPDRFPIYDQHVHRAMVFIREGRLEELGDHTDDQKIESYLQEYLPFYRTFERGLGGARGRDADRALLTFGSFLRTQAWMQGASASPTR